MVMYTSPIVSWQRCHNPHAQLASHATHRTTLHRCIAHHDIKFPEMNIHVATDDAELRAAAYLRAAAFYQYPSDRSQFAMRSHRRLKADTEWKALEGRIHATDPVWKAMNVTCFLATVPHNEHSAALLLQGEAALDRSGQLPASEQHDLGARLVVGTLDTNQGAVLPSEELIGRLPAPSEGDAAQLRAYLSNVCVADAARRQGVAQNLLMTAAQHLAAQGVRYMYVHVAADNAAAVQLYMGPGGFGLEQEESEAAARALGRPRRLLLVQELAL